jgi:hypothetical protein
MRVCTMGMNDRELAKREEKRNAKRQRNLTITHTVSMAEVDLEVLAHCIDCIISSGGALRIGATRDRGCWAFGIYGDGPTPYTEYVRSDEDLNKYLMGIAEFFRPTQEKP